MRVSRSIIRISRINVVLVAFCCTCNSNINAQSSIASRSKKSENLKLNVKEIFQRMEGEWKGECKTWFRPNELADTSEVSGKIEAVMGNFLRHTYQGSMKSKPRRGEELIGFDEITGKFRVAWIDDFHMSKAIMFSEGESSDSGFSVVGKYEVGADQPAWSWRTTYQLIDENRLTITAYNITPDGTEGKAVETKYQRQR